MPPLRKSEVFLPIAALLGALVFFGSLGRLWPMARTDVAAKPREMEARARAFLEGRGERLDGFRSASELDVDTDALDYVETALGAESAQRLIADGLPLVTYHVSLKKAGEPDGYGVVVHPEAGVLGFSREVEEDEPGARIEVDDARRLAREALFVGLRLEASAWEEKAVAVSEKPDRRDHVFTYERLRSTRPELRERATVVVAGDRVVLALREVVVPGPAKRAARAHEAPARALEAAGFLLAALAALAAFVVFLLRLRAGTARLGPAAVWIAVVAVAQLSATALQTSRLFAAWEPLWPRWVSAFRFLLFQSAGLAWTAVVLLAFVVAGDALDRESGALRGESLWALGRGRLLDPAVAAASIRGFLVGLVCGGVLAGSVLALEFLVGAPVSIQPRGFFFYALNAASPSLSTILFFLMVALAEELGYRFFGATWILARTGKRWLAVLVPAILYGLTHTRLDFLPPAEPFWGRAVVMTLVGCVWGVAFLRYDALTVVLSHYTADLFLFNWPRLGSGHPEAVLSAGLTVLVPLLPALLWLLRTAWSRARKRETMSGGGG